MGENSPILDAMKATNINEIDLSLIGKVHKVVDDWLFKGKPLKPLELEVIAEYSDDFENWDALNIYARIQPGVDLNGFGMPLIIATLPNSIALNDYLTKLQERGLDEDDDFKIELRSLLESRQTATKIEATLGDTDNTEFEAVASRFQEAAKALAYLLRPNQNNSPHIPGIAET